MSIKYKNGILKGIQVLFIALFLYTSIDKVFNFTEFAYQIKQSPLLKSIAGWLIWFIPAIEFLTAALLLFPNSRLQGFYTSLALMIAFTGYLVLLNYVSDYIPCDCGGFLEKLPLEVHICLNVSFVILALVAIKMLRQIRIESNLFHKNKLFCPDQAEWPGSTS